MSFHFFSTTCLPLRSPRVFVLGLLVECLNPRWSSEALSSFSLNPCPSFRGSAVQGTLCRTWLSRDPTGTVPSGAFPVWKENRPILADPERPYKPLMNVCWTALGWIQCQPQLYASPGTHHKAFIWSTQCELRNHLEWKPGKKYFPLQILFFSNMSSSFLFTNPPENKRSLRVVVR